ncbi:chemotaxis protein CheD [Pseudoduganella lurida]|uniref:Chemotaxis protein CheD n=1 Tax=Pseudoduganella lurida TaxID=1036180 RepID=A0A562REL0_9BURK|nr:chemotaxis protein CheD [Pseudoduganella lurida]TWI67353.1 chemotaxis protein CheD [Pseudoduganella lurida]
MNALAKSPEMHVLSGEFKVGSGADVLTCLLGSCVGIGIFWKRGGRCGLAHCLLPESAAGSRERSTRYVTAAIPALLMAMGVRREQYGEVEVVIAGGARMLALAHSAIGAKNVATAEEQLSRSGLSIRFADTGGYQGRRMRIECQSQHHTVTKIAPVERCSDADIEARNEARLEARLAAKVGHRLPQPARTPAFRPAVARKEMNHAYA